MVLSLWYERSLWVLIQNKNNSSFKDKLSESSWYTKIKIIIYVVRQRKRLRIPEPDHLILICFESIKNLTNAEKQL